MKGSKKYGILAYPAGHSLSPAMHNAAFKALGINSIYGAYEVPENKLAQFMKFVRSEPIDGLSVSLPYKELVMQYLDEIDADAGKIGAINTIVNKNGYLFGFNTDYVAASKALLLGMKVARIPKKDPIAVVIGAGGAARAVCYGLLELGIHVWVANRTKTGADRIAMEFAELFHDAEIHSVSMNDVGTGDILVNTTSIWTKNPEIETKDLPYFCNPNYVKEFKIIMDICYQPLETPLIKSAKKLNKVIVTGDKMLLYQAMYQFKVWTGKAAPEEVMKEALEGKMCF